MLYVVRHPKPDIAAGICYGQLDVPLPADWQQHCDWSGFEPIINKAVRLICSPLARCQLLAQQIATRHGLGFEVDTRLMELDFGDWEGQAWDDINDPQLAIWMEDYLNAPVSHGESWQDLKHRLSDFLAEYHDAGEHLVLFTHAGVIRTLQHLLQGTPMATLFAQTIPYCEPMLILPRHP